MKIFEAPRSTSANGWTLFNYICITILITTFFILITDNDLVNGLKTSIRATARFSFILFLITFTASGLVTLVPAPSTKYILRNRKWLGLAFAFSHFVHALLIFSLACSSDDYRSSFDAFDNASGFVGYVFIVLMTATSFKPTRRFVGERNWRMLHTSGMWIFAYIFWKTNYELLPQGALYVICLNVMSSAIAVQLIAKIAREIKLNSRGQKI